VTGHWEGAGGHADHQYCDAEVRSIQKFHFAKGYIDIAYNWLVCLHGTLFEGRPALQFRSAAQRDGNPLRVSVCFMWGPAWNLTAGAKAAFMAAVVQSPPGARNQIIAHADEPSCQTSCAGAENNTWIHSGHELPVPQMPHPPTPKALPPTGFHHPLLQEGNVGPAVLELQAKLQKLSGAPHGLDGIFGPATKQAVINWQKVLKIGVDGIAGQQTWNTIDWVYASRGLH
jgi:hypothetical protein